MPAATRESFAKDVVSSIHPTGKYRKLVLYQIYQRNDIISFEMQINWADGISEKIYK